MIKPQSDDTVMTIEGLETQIADMKVEIKLLKKEAQYADGQAYYQEMNNIHKKNTHLQQLELELHSRTRKDAS